MRSPPGSSSGSRATSTRRLRWRSRRLLPPSTSATARPLLARELGRPLLAEGLDALTEIVRLPEQAVRQPLDLEAEVERPVVGAVEHALRHSHRERREAAQLPAERLDG